MNTLPVLADWYVATEVGLTITGDPTLAQIDDELALWNIISELSKWAIADLVKFAYEKYGEEEAYGMVSLATRYHKSYLYNIVMVANKVAPAQRRSLNNTNMTFTHHQAVAPLSPELQDAWLDYATEKQQSRDELREDIKEHGTPPINILPMPKQVVIEVKPTLEETVVRYVRAVQRDNLDLAHKYFLIMESQVEDKL